MTVANPTQPGPFDLFENDGATIGNATIADPGVGAWITLTTTGPFGRQDLRKIAHRLMNIADFDTGLRE
jgi:hypothetical protein